MSTTATNQGKKITDAIIPSGSSVSNSIALGTASLIGFIMSSAWTTAALNIETSIDGVNWQTSLYTQDSTQIGSFSSPSVSGLYNLNPVYFLAPNYIRFRSGTFGSPVNQSADRTISVISRPIA